MADKPLELHLGVSFVQYGDHDEFSQYGCYEWGGDCETKSSDASAMQIYGDYGLKKRFGPHNGGFYTLRGGFSALMGSERSIDNCDNCYSEDIDISGGLYGLAGIGFNATQNFSMGLNYKHYISGDFGGAFALDLRWAY